MAGSTYGTVFRIMTWGESHGKGIGVTIDGCPAGLALCEDCLLYTSGNTTLKKAEIGLAPRSRAAS